MKIAILGSTKTLYSTERMIEEAESRGHEVLYLKIRDCYMSLMSKTPQVHYSGDRIVESVDCVIPRIGSSVTFYGTAVLRHFEMMGAFCLNSSISIARSRDKLRSLQLLSRKDIPMPRTGFANSPADTKALVEMVGGAPLILKLLESTQGKGVVLAETMKAAESVIDSFKSLQANFLVQEFIAEAVGRDIRCFVIGNKVVASMQRIAQGDDFRSNLHKGGRAEPIDITPEERRIAIQAADVMGLHVAGVDLIRSPRGPMVLEVNSSPGLEGIEKSTGQNVARSMIEYLEKEVGRTQPSLLNMIRNISGQGKDPNKTVA